MGQCFSVANVPNEQEDTYAVKLPPRASLTTTNLEKSNEVSPRESSAPAAVSAGLNPINPCIEDIYIKTADSAYVNRDASHCVQLTPASCASSFSSLPSVDAFSDSFPFVEHANADAVSPPPPSSAITLLYAQFTRTLFCEDITYEYVMSCDIQHMPRWVVRLSVESLTDFVNNVLANWHAQQQPHSQSTVLQIPCQFGNVMPTTVFTSVVTAILRQHSSIFRDAHFGAAAADLFNLPADVRCFIQYRSEQYVHALDAFSTALGDKYKYLCHSGSDNSTSHKYWIRSLQYKIDFFVLYARTRCSQVFTVAMADDACTIVNVLTNDVGLDIHCAWVIADYLPKNVSFDDACATSSSQIVYRFDQPPVATHSEQQCGTFFLQDDNVLLARHNAKLHELEAWCASFCAQHVNGALHASHATSPTLSLSEFIESFSEGLGDDSDDDEQELPSLYLSENDQKPSETITWSDYEVSDDEDEDEDEVIEVSRYRSFFEDAFSSTSTSLNAQQWTGAVHALHLELSEQQISDAFVFITRLKTEPNVEFMDFLYFCQSSNMDSLDVECVQRKINAVITCRPLICVPKTDTVETDVQVGLDGIYIK